MLYVQLFMLFSVLYEGFTATILRVDNDVGPVNMIDNDVGPVNVIDNDVGPVNVIDNDVGPVNVIDNDVGPVNVNIGTNDDKDYSGPLKVDNEDIDVCTLPVDPGPCDVYSTMFYFNMETRTCEKFRFGGCEGNGNKFYDFWECERECHVEDKPRSVCTLPLEIGNCSYEFPQYFYNASANECQPFVYTGCNGNDNRFYDMTCCQDLCLVEEDLCDLPKDSGVGPYNAKFYFYNRVTGNCEDFIYKGALGNDNRFYDKEECEMTCMDIK